MSLYYRTLIQSGRLLDIYPNAAVAYSLRKLRSSYTGAAIEVTRSSDFTALDIGFDSSGELDTTTLLDFVGYNLWTYSEQMQQTAWFKIRTIVTADAVVAPDGNMTGDILFETIVSGTHGIFRAQAVTIGEDYSVSFYIKDEGRRYFQIRVAVNLSTDNINPPTAMLDLTTGTVISDNGFFRVAPIITAVGSGWYKIEYGLIANSTTTSNALIIEYSINGTQIAYIGDITKGMAIWGVQISQTSTIKPYQKTEASAGTSATISKWYDQSGNNRNCSQVTVTAQASIVNNRTFTMIGDKITTTWSVDHYIISPAFTTNKPLVSTYVFKRNGIGNNGQCASLSNTGSTIPAVFRWLGAGSNNMTTYLNTARTHSINNQTLGYFLLTTYKTAADFVNVRNNTVELSGGISTGNGTINSFGNANGSATIGNVNEVILWYEDYVSLIPNIETKINEYYAIY